MAPYTPTDAETLEAVEAIQAEAADGKLGRAKVRAKLKEIFPDWILSEKRLKGILSPAAAEPEPQDTKFGIPQEPGAALLKHEAYVRDSTRTFFIYGPGEYNYGVSPNAHMGILIDIARGRLAKALQSSWSQDQYRQRVCDIRLETFF